MMSRVTLRNWKRGYISEKLNASGSEVSEFNKEFVDLFSSQCSLNVHTLKFHLLDHMLEDVKRFGERSVLEESDHV